MQSGQFGSKTKNDQKVRKRILRPQGLFSEKRASKTSQCSKNESILKMAQIGHHAWAIAYAKWLVWVKNRKRQKGAKNDWTKTLELMCAKKPVQKRVMFER